MITLFLVSLVCLGSWITTFKLAGKRWRFELFSIDFALGAVLLSLLTAFTLGSAATDLPFSDRVLLSSKTAQALVFSAGFIFGLANLLLLGAVSLLGIAGAFPICIGLGFIVHALLNFSSYNSGAGLAGLAFLAVGVLLVMSACRSRDLAVSPAKKPLNQALKTAGARSIKGFTTALIAGVLFGLVYYVAEGGIYSDLGLGPYAGLLYFCVGILVSTLTFSVVFFNIALEGVKVSPGSYLTGSFRQHVMGIAGGALWSVGVLTAFSARIKAADTGRVQALIGVLPIASALLALLWGFMVWKEFATTPGRTRVSLMGTAALLIGSCLLIALARAH